MLITDEKVYKALVKCNDIGRKMGAKSLYIMVNGMIMFHPCDKYSKYNTRNDNSIIVAFIHDKIMEGLGDLLYIPLHVNGDEFYQMNKEYGKGFKSIDVTPNDIKITYEVEVTEDATDLTSKFIEKFLSEHEEYDFVYPTMFTTDITVISEYKKFLLLYTPETVSKEYTLTIDTLVRGKNDDILNHVDEYKDKMKLIDPQTVQTNIIEPEIVEMIKKSERPMEVKFKLSTNEVYSIRMMKSLLGLHSKNDAVEIKIAPINLQEGLIQNIIVIRQKEFTICSSYMGFIY